MAYKLYKRRWLMLALFCLASALNSCHWIQYSIITNIVVKYYNVSTLFVNWSANVFSASFLVLALPAILVLKRWGLKTALILGVSMMVAGSWIKLFSLNRDYFIVAFLCQLIIGSAQVFILSLPARLANLWFSSREAATACAIGVFGNLVGIASGFLLPPVVVDDSDRPSEIRSALMYLHIGIAAPTTALLVAVVVFFEESPPLPPSPSQFALRLLTVEDEVGFFGSLKELYTNSDYVLLLVAFGLNIGVFYAYSTLLNQLFLAKFPRRTAEAGRIGLTLVLGGMLGTVTLGFLLDRTQMYRAITLSAYVCSIVSMSAFTASLYYGQLLLIYIASACLGFFTTGYLPLAYELAGEITYPLKETTSTGILNWGGEAISTILVYGCSVLLLHFQSELLTNIVFISLLILGLTVSFFITAENLRRSIANAGE